MLNALDGFPDNIHDYIHSDIVDEGEEVSWSKSYDITELKPTIDMIETKINQGLGREYEDSEENRKLLRKVIKWMSTKQFDKIVNYYHISASDMKSELIKARDAIHDSDR